MTLLRLRLPLPSSSSGGSDTSVQKGSIERPGENLFLKDNSNVREEKCRGNHACAASPHSLDVLPQRLLEGREVREVHRPGEADRVEVEAGQAGVGSGLAVLVLTREE